MAYYDGGFSGRDLTLRLNVNLSSQNVAGNISTVYWSLFIIKSGNVTAWSNAGSNWTVGINGQIWTSSFNYDFRSMAVGDAVMLADGYASFSHNSDGTATIYNTGSVAGADPIGNASVDGYLTLPTIPRASTPTFTNPVQIGNTMTINTNRASSTFTHTIDWVFGSASGQVGTGITTSATWTPPLTLLNQIPNSSTGNGILRTTTYNGGTLIGQTSVGFTLTAGSTIVPSFTTITHTEATPGVAANIGGYVQNISRLTLAITGAAGVYGSTISSYKIVVNNQTINAVSGTTPGVITQASSALSITGTVTDSRGRTASKTVNIVVLAYVPPQLTSASFQRALAAGTPNEEGTYIRANINAQVASLIVGGVQKNELVYKLYTRQRGTTAWTLKRTQPTGGVSFNSYGLINPYSITTAWEVLLEVSDDFNITSLQGTIATSSIFMHWGGNGEGIGIGKYWERGALDVKGEIFHLDGDPTGVPAGTVVSSARATAPLGWVICNGQALSRTVYSRLFDAIGTTYGVGNGTTTFNVPNMNGRVAAGHDTSQTEFNTIGKQGGAKTHTLSAAEMPTHSHAFLGGHSWAWGVTVASNVWANGTSAATGTTGGNALATSQNAWTGTVQAGSGGAHNNLPPYTSLLSIIKA